MAHANVTINNLCPERFDTDRQRQMAELAVTVKGITLDEAYAEMRASIAARRLGDPAEFGDACAFLCSAQAGYVSGQSISLDGGSSPGCSDGTTPDPRSDMTFEWDPEHKAFVDDHTWAVLATGRADGSPQQSMIGYVVDVDGQLVVSAKAYTAKWKNAVRQPKVSLTVPDGRQHLVVYGTAETIDADPERARAHGGSVHEDERERRRPCVVARHARPATANGPAHHADQDPVPDMRRPSRLRLPETRPSTMLP